MPINGSEDAEVYMRLGMLLSKSGRKGEAKEAYNQAIRRNPNCAEAHYGLGLILGELGQNEEAEKAYRQAIRCNPNFTEAYFGLGYILSELHRKTEAEEPYRQAIRCNPDYGEAYLRLGNLLMDFGRHEEAEELFHQAIRCNPDPELAAIAYYCLGIVLVDLEKYEVAEGVLRQSISHDPDFAAPYEALGDFYSRMQRYAAAVEAFQHVLRIDPDSEDVKRKCNEAFGKASISQKRNLELREAIRKGDPNAIQFARSLGKELVAAWKHMSLEPLELR